MTRPRSHRLALAAIILFLLTPPFFGQDFRYLHHQAWSTEDGLPQNSVHQILQTADGFLWIATEGGLARFDGLTFQTFDHANTPAFASDDICCLAADPAGDLWVGTSDGILRLHNQTFTRVDERSARPPEQILSVLSGSGSASGQEGRATGPRGQVWTYSRSTVSLTANGRRRQWTAADGVPGSRIETVAVDHTGSAWIGTNDGLATLTPESATAKSTPVLRGNAILAIYEDREGNHWVGSETSGLHLFSPVKFRTESVLAEKALTALAHGDDGSVWFGTRKDGLLRLRADDTLASSPAPSDSLTSPTILCLAPAVHGGVWAGTPDGLNLVTATGHVTRITSADGLPDDYIQAMVADPDGSLWIGTRRGLAHLHPRPLKIDVLTQQEGLGGDLIGDLLLTSAKSLWIASSGGLSRLNLNNPGDSIETSNHRSGLPPGIVTALAEDPSGTLWIATRGSALTRFSGAQFQTLQSPASKVEIAGMSADSRGFLWLRTTQGVERATLADLNRCASSNQPCATHFDTYGTADGMPSVELASSGSPVLLRMPGGELWTTTRRGVAITDPDHLPFNSAPPLVAIERFLVDELPTSATSTMQLPYGHTRFTMEYAALSFTVPTAIRYRYLLQGFDRIWIEAGSRRSATYTNLPPGTYHFRVQAANNDGVWSDSTAPLSFRVVPPIYRTWWFVALTLLFVAAIVVATYRLRLRRIQSGFDAVLKERNRLAREIHDTLAQDFVGVSIQLDLTAQFLSLNLVPAALEQVHAARKLVTDGLADARQSIWGLRANLTQGSLPTRLAKVVARYSTDSLPIRSKIGGAFRKLDARLENEVLRITQECLSNIQRHSEATEASIELRYGGDMLVLTVADDGRGFSPEEAAARTERYGLGGMRERAVTIQASFEIVSAPHAGTRIVLSVPIPGAQSMEIAEE